MPQPTAAATTSATKPAKSSTKTKKEKYAFDGLNGPAIIALLKQKNGRIRKKLQMLTQKKRKMG